MNINHEFLKKFEYLNDDEFEHELVYKLAHDICVDSKLSDDARFLILAKESFSRGFVLELCEFLVVAQLIDDRFIKALKGKGGRNSAKADEKNEACRCWKDWQANKGMYKNQEAFILDMQIKLGVSRQTVINWLNEFKTLQKSTNSERLDTST